MSFPTDPTNLDTFQNYLFENNEWKKRMVADQGDKWIKFHNGIMFQYGEITADASGNAILVFPEVYFESPIAIADSWRNGYWTAIESSDADATTTGMTVRSRGGSQATDTQTSTGPILWFTAGLWKTFEPFEIDTTATRLGKRIYSTDRDAYIKYPALQSGSVLGDYNNYWMEFDDGVMIQFGKVNATNADTVSYPRVFGVEPTVITNMPRTGYRCTNGTGDINPTVSSFQCYHTDITLSSAFTSITRMNWFALGEV